MTTVWTNGDVSGAQTLTDADHLYPSHINELRTAFNTTESVINVKDYGVKGDGITDDTAAINAMMVALGVPPAVVGLNKTIYFPTGTYLISDAIVVRNKNIVITGDGPLQTTIQTSSTTADGFNIDISVAGLQMNGVCVKDMTIQSSVTKTAGDGIHFNSSQYVSYLDNLYINGFYNNIYLYDVSFLVGSRLTLFGGASGGYDMVISGSGGSNDNRFSDIKCDDGEGGAGVGGFLIENVNHCQFINIDIEKAQNGISIIPNASGVGNLYFTNVRAQRSWHNGLLSNAAGNINFVNCSFLNNDETGAYLTGANEHFYFNNCYFYGNSDYGIHLVGSANLDVVLANSVVTHNGYTGGNGYSGVLIDANTSRFRAVNNYMGPTTGVAHQQNYGIEIAAGTSSHILIADNDLHGCVTNGLSFGGTAGTANYIVNNIGYNPVGVTGTIAVGTSPFTYTAGETPEYMHITGGTVSLIAKGTVNLFAETNHTIPLEPYQTVTVTYSGTPYMVKDIK